VSELELKVNGQVFSGWKGARVTRSIECISGAFELEVTDRWSGQEQPWPIREEDACELLLAGTRVISGHVDSRRVSLEPAERSLSISGRDRAGLLVDCSAVLGKWEFLGVDVLTLAKAIAAPFEIPVALQAGLAPRPVSKLTIDPGDSAFEAIERACRLAGVLAVSDGAGGVLLTRAGTALATTALVEGENILGGEAEFEGTGRFSRYLVTGQRKGTDEDYGAAAAMVQGSARDAGVRRTSRVLMVRAEAAVTQEQARQRAEWEAKVRAGRAETARITVLGWTQGGGALWPVNAQVQVRSPALGLAGEMLITGAIYRLDGGGTTTELRLMRPDAFLPEPVVAESKAKAWAELGKAK
jgi:prophage tail gpP-like protein